jgi:cytochrome c
MQELKLTHRVLRRILVTLMLIGGLAGCFESEAAGLAGDPDSIGDPSKGEALIRKLGCGSCHDIPGIIGAHGMVGPPP